jgi:hypothetical protein
MMMALTVYRISNTYSHLITVCCFVGCSRAQVEDVCHNSEHSKNDELEEQTSNDNVLPKLDVGQVAGNDLTAASFDEEGPRRRRSS